MAEENKLEKVTYISVITDDHGQFGSSYCGNCGYHLSEKDSRSKCAQCDYSFNGMRDDSRSFGGSDF